MIRFGRASLPIRLRDVLADLGDQLVVALEVALEGDEGADRLAGVLVGLADHRRLGDLRVRDDRRLDLGGREPVAGDVDHVVDAPDDPEVAVLVVARGVADEVGRRGRTSRSRSRRSGRPPCRACAASPATACVRASRPCSVPASLPLLVDHRAPRSRAAACPPSPASSPGRPGSVVIMIAPVSVCHQVSTIGQRSPPITLQYQSQAFGLIGSPTVPSRRSDERSCLLGVLGAPLHAGADRGRRGVEDRHPVALDELPPDVLVGVVGRALVHHRGRAVEQRPVDDVGVAGDPADVGRAPVDVLLGLQVEDVAGASRRRRSGSRRWCAGCPSASRSSPRCRG